MAQNRKAPAYQEYPAAILANREFRLMSLESRGLVWTMRLECWENKNIPSSPYHLAKTLGFQYEELKNALTSEVLSFFVEFDGVYMSPELESYRAHINERKRAQAEGGKKGAAKTNSYKKSGKSQLPRQVESESLVKSNPEKQNQASIYGETIETKLANDYAKESNGG